MKTVTKADSIMSSESLEIPDPFDIQSSGGSLSEFLKKNVFAQRKNSDVDGDGKDDAEAVNRITHAKEPVISEENKSGLFQLVQSFQGFFDKDKDDEKEQAKDSSPSKTTSSILDIAKSFNDNVNNTLKETDSNKEIEQFWKLIQECKDQWSTVAEDSKVKEISPLAFMYFIGFEESRKTPSYRRRQHRFCPSLEVDTLHDLHDALYLATISYMHKVDDISEALDNFNGSPWVMVYCDVTSRPHEPAHYICLKKEQDKIEGGGFRWPWEGDKILDVLLVVRGTKEMPDILSDALIEASPYEDGMAHSGIQKSGCYLIDKHTEFLEKLLKESGRDRIRLSIIGHSLGAGAGAIAAIEWNKKEWVEAKAIGFGCPAILSKELSESTKDFITTVVCDSDVVPRMSGATISNVVNDVMSRSYKEMAMVDVHQVLDAVDANSPIKPSEKQKKSIVEHIEKSLDLEFSKYQVEYSPIDIVLFPPGKCIHLYADGTGGYSGTYVPCTFFDRIDVNRTMIDDHMTASGYSRVFHEVMRNHLDDYRFTFPHNVEEATKKCQ